MTQKLLWGCSDLAKARGVTTASISQLLKNGSAPQPDFVRSNGSALWLPETIQPWLDSLPEVKKQRKPRRQHLYDFYTCEGYFSLFLLEKGIYSVVRRIKSESDGLFDEPSRFDNEVTRFYCASDDPNGEVWDIANKEIARILGPEKKRETLAFEYAKSEYAKLKEMDPELTEATFVFTTQDNYSESHVYDLEVKVNGCETVTTLGKRGAKNDDSLENPL